MSHKATLWAIEQRGLKPTTKIVLWHLCDRFNPDFGCFPSQARLAEDCESLAIDEAAELCKRISPTYLTLDAIKHINSSLKRV